MNTGNTGNQLMSLLQIAFRLLWLYKSPILPKLNIIYYSVPNKAIRKNQTIRLPTEGNSLALHLERRNYLPYRQSIHPQLSMVQKLLMWKTDQYVIHYLIYQSTSDSGPMYFNL